MRRRKVDTRKCARDDANQHSNTIKCKCTRSTWKCVCVCVFEIEPKLKSAIWSTKTFTPGHQIDHWMKHLNNCVIINCIHDPLSPTITINIHSKGFQHCHQHSFRLPFFFCFGRVCLSQTLYRHFGDDKFSWHTCKQIGGTLVCYHWKSHRTSVK